MDISRAQVEKLGQLARLALTDQEVDIFVSQLPKIVDYVGQLQQVDTVAIADITEPTTNLRPDEAVPFSESPAIIAQAPERVDHFWKVDGVFS